MLGMFLGGIPEPRNIDVTHRREASELVEVANQILAPITTADNSNPRHLVFHDIHDIAPPQFSPYVAKNPAIA